MKSDIYEIGKNLGLGKKDIDKVVSVKEANSENPSVETYKAGSKYGTSSPKQLYKSGSWYGTYSPKELYKAGTEYGTISPKDIQ